MDSCDGMARVSGLLGRAKVDQYGSHGPYKAGMTWRVALCRR